jgi:hypothetical protein
MYQRLSQAFGQTLATPQEGLRQVLDWRLDRGSLWAAAVVVVIISVLLNGLLVVIKPELLAGPQMIPTSPFIQALVVWGGMILTVYGTHYIGKMFGGTGSFDQSLCGVIWLQTVLLVFQVGQVVLLTVSEGVGAMASIGLFVYTVWLFVNFVAVIHGFKSLWMVFVGFIGSSIGVGFGLLILFSIIAIVTGIDIQNV